MNTTRLIPWITQLLHDIRTALYNPITPVTLYALGGFTILLAIVVFPFIALPSFRTFFVLIGIGSTLLSIGFCWDAFIRLKTLAQDNIAGAIIIGFPSSALIATLAIVTAEHLVNKATHLNPDHFNNSVKILASISAPFILAHAIAAIATLYYIITMLGLVIKVFILYIQNMLLIKRHSTNKDLLNIFRAVSAGILAFQMIAILEYLPKKASQEITSFTQSIIAFADHYQYGDCKTVLPWERYNFIDKNKVTIVDNRYGVFSIRTDDCNKKVK